MKPFSTLKSLIVGLALAVSSAGAFSEYTRLIDSNPVLPPVLPKLTGAALALSAAPEVVDRVAPALLQLALRQELSRILPSALTEATALGQPGVLFKVTIATASVGLQDSQYLVGPGITYLGAGPSAGAVCYAMQCHKGLSAAAPEGTVISAKDSQYIWLNRVAGTTQVIASYYDTVPMERWTQSTVLNVQANSAFKAAATTAFFDGYARQLTLNARTEGERKQVEALLQQRDAAVTQLRAIDSRLSAQLDKAQRAAKAAATFQALSGVFSIAANVALASVAVGEELKTTAGQTPVTQAELLAAVNRIEAQSTAAANRLLGQQAELQKSMNESLDVIRKLGSDLGMAIPNPQMKILLH